MVRFLRSSAAKFVAVLSGPVGALLTIYGFFSHGKVVPLWSGLIFMAFAALVAVYRAIGERESEIREARDLMVAQRKEFTSLVDGLNADLQRQEEQAASDRSHYETELTLLKNAIAVPTVSLVREPDPHHSNGQVFVLVNKSNAEATNITVCDLVIPIPPRVQKQWHEMHQQFSIPSLETPTLEKMPHERIVHFRPVKDLARDDKATLEYITENGGPLMTIETYLADADSLIHDGYIATCQIIIEYSNSNHSRRWRRTYEFHYVITGRREWLESKGVVEITGSTAH